MGLKKMNLGGGVPSGGREKQGMIACYILQFEDGSYYGGVIEGYHNRPRHVDNWSDARFFFGVTGLLELRRIREYHQGTVIIVNCTPPEPYYKQ